MFTWKQKTINLYIVLQPIKMVTDVAMVAVSRDFRVVVVTCQCRKEDVIDVLDDEGWCRFQVADDTHKFIKQTKMVTCSRKIDLQESSLTSVKTRTKRPCSVYVRRLVSPTHTHTHTRTH